jgi:hypothetical protein
LDILQLDETYLSLGAIVWAACGKDEGYTPHYLIQMLNRHSRYQESDLQTEHLVRPVDLKALKTQWVAAIQMATELFERLPPDEIGCLYLDEGCHPVTPDPDSPGFSKLIRHRGSVSGAWPAIS